MIARGFNPWNRNFSIFLFSDPERVEENSGIAVTGHNAAHFFDPFRVG
jgi:hypothetical protein